jgi:hypothetical protein
LKYIANLLVLPVFSAVLFAAADAPTPTVVSSFRTDSSPAREFMTNEGVVLLSDAGFSDAFIVEKVMLSHSRFDTTVEGLAYLRRSGLSEELVLFLLEHSAKPAVAPAAAQVPAPIPMKVVKMKVLVPQTGTVPAPPVMMPMSQPLGGSASQWYLYPSSPVAPATYPVLRSPRLPAVANMPVMTPPNAEYVGTASR